MCVQKMRLGLEFGALFAGSSAKVDAVSDFITPAWRKLCLNSVGEEILAHYRAGPPGAVNSLLADRLAGRRMETDARNGAIARKGEKHGIPTPLNRMAVALLDAQQPQQR